MRPALRRRSLWWGTASVLTALWGLGQIAPVIVDLADGPPPGEHRIQIVVEDGLPWGISQEAVDAVAAQDPPSASVPLTVRVTDEYLTVEQSSGKSDLPEGTDAVLSISPDTLPLERYPTASSEEEPPPFHAGLAWDRDTFAALEALPVMGAYWLDRQAEEVKDSLLLRGQGPTAVVEALRRMGRMTVPPPEQNLAERLGPGVLALSTASLMGIVAVRLRRGEQERGRALRRAQARFGRTVLELEAVDLAVGLGQSSAVGTALLHGHGDLQHRFAQLLTEDAQLHELERTGALHSSQRAVAARLRDFDQDTRDLQERVQALVDAGEVALGTAQAEAAAERVVAPLLGQVRLLLAQVDELPPSVVSDHLVSDIEDRADELAAVAFAAGRGRLEADRRREWLRAEQRLSTSLKSLARELIHQPGMDRTLPPTSGDGALAAPRLTRLRRRSLGLPALPAGDVAVHVSRLRRAVGRLGGEPVPPVQRTTSAPEPAAALPGWVRFLGLVRPADHDAGRAARWTKRAWISAAVLLLVPATFLAGETGNAIERALVGTDGTGRPVQARSVTVDVQGDVDAPDLDQDRLEAAAGSTFDHPVDIVLAVRPALSYVEPQGEHAALVDPEQADRFPVEVDADGVVAQGVAIGVNWLYVADGLERLRHEFPQKLDPVTGELRQDQVIVPIYVFPDGRAAVLIAQNSDQQASNLFLEYAGENEREIAVTDDVTAAVQGSLSRSADRHRISPLAGEAALVGNYTDAFILPWLVVLLSGMTVAEAVLFSASGLRGVGSFGRDARRLRSVRRRLQALLLGLDESRLHSEAVLGAGEHGPAKEAGQRLYELELDAAWRAVRSLEDLTLPERLRGQAGPVLDDLESTVTALESREERAVERVEWILSGASSPAQAAPGRDGSAQ